MTMVASGTISLGGSVTSGGFNESANIELGQAAGANITMNYANLRALAAVGGSGTSWAMSALYGKSSYRPSLYVFTTSGSMTIPAGMTSINVMIVGGGAASSGGYTGPAGGPGGGGGQVYTNTSLAVTPGQVLTYTVAGPTTTTTNGFNSSISSTATGTITALGGRILTVSYVGGSSGSGNLGGTSANGSTTPYGNAGGGGGQGAVGSNGIAASHGGAGGAGVSVTINGNTYLVGGGGGGGSAVTGQPPGTASHGGGAGGVYSGAGTSGTANTGGGGGGGGGNLTTFANGGSGIIVFYG